MLALFSLFYHVNSDVLHALNLKIYLVYSSIPLVRLDGLLGA